MKLLLILLAISFQSAFSQVGIGNTSPKAQLDISASSATAPTNSDGILIPRINAFPSINPTAAQDGMLVFLTNSVGTNLPGFYYWSQPALAWVGIDSNNKSWDVSGNASAVSGTNFIGTTNAQDVDFRTNNSIKMRLTQKGQIEILNTGKSVFLGQQAGANDNLANRQNVFVGYQSGLSSTSGANNAALGYQSLRSNTIGNFNAAFGGSALQANVTGAGNTASGQAALFSNTTGNDNTAVGHRALYASTASNGNTAVGMSALHDNTIGADNTATGQYALTDNVSGYSNTASGSYALEHNATGSNNTASGSNALSGNVSGSNNTALGANSLVVNATGETNSAVGFSAMLENTTGYGNSALGGSALYFNTEGNSNTAAGISSLRNNTTGDRNAAIGDSALSWNETGNNNTALGNRSNVSLPSGISGATAIGTQAVVNTSNKMRLGSAAVTVIEGQVAYAYPSDARFKNNIKQNVPGLDFILQLKPVTYQFDTKKFDAHLMQNLPSDLKGDTDYAASSAIVHTGFLAQDVEKAAQSIGYDFDGLHLPDASNPTDNYSVAYSQFVMPMVKAIQEQQAQIESVTQENKSLKAAAAKQAQMIESLEKRLSALERRP
ncbi:tail fiber domain-containing protein [Flavobacterium caeni]|uniref:Chaperone of endosialidase n=1 Tax=Flavobacterium caeni TaxID=490189 RepID=A0A1G5EFH1_9FLAO|nr:tail fiber domain-containing protein [Flavobacterium caeni]SCY25706.1 Chaperone of endosialidase [Flavobacterium caeni]